MVSDGSRSPVAGAVGSKSYLGAQADTAYRNYQSMLPDIYTGHPNRVDRYMQYENMDLDSEIGAALDILAEFCTQKNEDTKTAFQFEFHDEATDSEIEILQEQLKAWYSLNEFDQKLFKLIRNTFKYGDQVFVRDPENFKWYWVEMNKVSKVVVNESQGKQPEIYFIRDLNPNLINNTITKPPGANDSYAFAPYMGGSRAYTAGGAMFSPSTRFGSGVNEFPVAAENVIHFSLTEGLDVNWPFGVSILEAIFKTFKQKELLEDALLIYRIQRAPERRIFYIDVGNMPAHMAMQFVERVKNEIHQRRIPSQTGGGSSIMDASYNPLSINEDYFFPQTAEGRGSKVETLPGGQNLGEIDDLRYFTNKLFRGLRIPSSYLPTGTEESAAAFSDGRIGTALIQEFRFNEYCKRLQKHMAYRFDEEFKLFLKFRGFNIDSSLFDIRMNEPQNFAAYREVELNQQRITGFTSINQTEYLSKRFMLKKYLGLTESEMEENDRMWREEKGEVEIDQMTGSDLRNVGVTPGGISGDIDSMDAMQAEPDMPPGAEAPMPASADAPMSTMPGSQGTSLGGGPGGIPGTTTSA